MFIFKGDEQKDLQFPERLVFNPYLIVRLTLKDIVPSHTLHLFLCSVTSEQGQKVITSACTSPRPSAQEQHITATPI